MIQFGPWEPDSSGVNIGVLSDARNVYANKAGYGPVQALAESGSDALPSKAVGKFTARASDGGRITFAGTQTKIYRLVSGAWVDYTRSSGGDYNVPTDDFWSFAQFGQYVIACNINDDVQVIDIDSGATAFSALGGSPPKARYVSVVGDFVVLGCLSTNNRKVRNSAINSVTGWTVGTNLCDEQEFPDGDRVTGVAGGEFGYVVQERALRRMIFQPGSDTAFRYERFEKERGAAAGYSVAATANQLFFLSDDGFYKFGAEGLVPIGAQRVNKWFRENSDTTRFFSVLAFTDPYAPRICWAFYNASGSTIFDRVIVYDWQLDRWSYWTEEAQYWATSVTAGLTLEDLDVYGSIDSGVPYSLDSRVWEGGAPVISAISSDGKEAFLESSLPLDARLTMSSIQLIPNGRAMVNSVEPIGVFNDATLAVRVGKRERTQSAVTYTASTTPSANTGVAWVRAGGRYHEVELSLTQASGTEWRHAQGFKINFKPDGNR
jgi:hypothetical protein